MLPVILLTGLDDEFRGAVAGNLLAEAGPAGVLVEYAVRDLSAVVRTARTAAGVIDREVITMSHPCVSCAMRGSLVQLLASIAAVERYGVAIVNVPAAGDTHAITTEIDQHTDLHVGLVVTSVDTATVLADLNGEDLLRERGIPTAAEDGRATAEVVVRQLEYADTAVLSTADSPTDSPTERLLQAINPRLSTRTTPAGLLDVRPNLPRTIEPGSIAAPVEGLTFVWQADRPFHPERLYDALEDLVAGTVRGRGTLWIATQHRHRLSWDSFGTNVAFGVLGPWLADLPADRWPSVGQQHQARSALEWHPEHGDRASYLSFTGSALDIRELQRRLDGCVLRADEAVHPLTDPFAPYLEGSTAA
ncbi:G3E family GTPase [Kribbella aluminosa]|uniref:G3E family GTPase n=1 Tax=Kribbella aluminosa TaxID=416017 RepID=A0ABS4UPC0_9ACTN|nr:GTP-binding protein [Kribbella aluminosa]MBP2353490.1 G3E family GTPase [Kribbella aluminosa]